MAEKKDWEIERELWFSEIGLANSEEEVEKIVLDKLESCPEWDEPFFVGNLRIVLDKFNLWTKELPGIDIFYAVKANDDPLLLKLLSALGTSFDCASKGEIDSVLKLGVSPSKIMFSNPYKLPSHLKHAKEVGVRWMVCDSMSELNKLHALCPLAKIVIRIHPRKETTSYLKMSAKFGCNFEEAKALLLEAKQLNMNVEGISFYVGHCTESPAPYVDAFEVAKEVYLEATKIGHNVQLLDIGGGFQGSKQKLDLFPQVAKAIRESVSKHFPPQMGIRVIGEPGQFMGIRAFDVYAKVIGVRQRLTEGGQRYQSVYVSGGHFGCIPNYNFKFNKTQVEIPNINVIDNVECSSTTFWGGSCDPMDCLVTVPFPQVSTCQWLRFTNLGAYTRSIQSQYNGFPLAPTKYFVDDKTREFIQ